jgi:hypothetical protein
LIRLGATALGVVVTTIAAVKEGDGSHGIMRLDADARSSLICRPLIPRPLKPLLGVASQDDDSLTVPGNHHESAL